MDSTIKVHSISLLFRLHGLSRLWHPNLSQTKTRTPKLQKNLTMEKPTTSSTCQQVPNLLSSFVDFFVSGGLFLPNYQNTLDSNTPGKFKTRYPSSSGWLVAINDLHGDLEKSKQALRLAELINDSGDWTGGSMTVVQVGHVLDRGGDEIKILYFLERLRRQAVKASGEVITMNVEKDFRYMSEPGCEEFRVWAHLMKPVQQWSAIINLMFLVCFCFFFFFLNF